MHIPTYSAGKFDFTFPTYMVLHQFDHVESVISMYDFTTGVLQTKAFFCVCLHLLIFENDSSMELRH